MNKKTQVLLSTITQESVYLPLALLYLKTSVLDDEYLEKRVEIEIKEFNQRDQDRFILYEIEKNNPKIIAFSCYIWNIQRILSLCLKLKAIDKDIKIILGGPQVSPIAETVLEKNKQIDFIVRGEGEITFRELIKTLLNSQKNFEMISGVTYKHNGQIVKNIDREMIADLDSIPSPYTANLKHLEDREVSLETQRGCIFKCDYCYYHKSFEKIRFFSIGRVKKDLSFLLQQKIKRIYLMDPVFNFDINRAKEICKFIIENNKKNITLHTEIRVEFIDDELAELFSKANVKYLEIGLQSTNKNVLHLVKRKLNFEEFVRGIELLKRYDFDLQIQLIFGLPGDTIHSFMKSLEQTLALKLRNLAIFRLMVLPGTEIWNNAKKLGIIYEDEPYHSVLRTNEISFNGMVKLEKIINSLFLFKDLWIIKCLAKDINIKLLDLIKLWLDWVNDDRFLLNFGYAEALKEKLRNFIIDLCQRYKDKVNLDFYNALLKKELNSSMEVSVCEVSI